MAMATRRARCQVMAMARHIQRRQKGWIAGQKKGAQATSSSVKADDAMSALRTLSA